MAVNRVGDRPGSRRRFHRADVDIRDVHEGQGAGLDDRGRSAQRLKATARQNLQLFARLGKQVDQHATIRAAADPLSGLVDEALGPMSHLGSIRGCGEPSCRLDDTALRHCRSGQASAWRAPISSLGALSFLSNTA
jgi:hypothetical protein